MSDTPETVFNDDSPEIVSANSPENKTDVDCQRCEEGLDIVQSMERVMVNDDAETPRKVEEGVEDLYKTLIQNSRQSLQAGPSSSKSLKTKVNNQVKNVYNPRSILPRASKYKAKMLIKKIITGHILCSASVPSILSIQRPLARKGRVIRKNRNRQKMRNW